MSVESNHVLSYSFGILAVLLNGLLLLSMYNERKKIFVTRISFLVANLALADCFNGLFLIVLEQPIEEIRYKSDVSGHLALPFTWTAFSASFYTLLLMAAERFVLIILPMSWSSLLTIPRTLVSIICAWLLSIAGGIALHFRRYYAQFFICLLIDVCTLCFTATHVYILLVLRKRRQFSYTAHNKVTTVVIILLAILIVTWVPYFVCLQMALVYNTFDPSIARKVDVDIYTKVFDYSETFSYVNYFINPIIYAWRFRMYRKAFYSLLRGRT